VERPSGELEHVGHAEPAQDRLALRRIGRVEEAADGADAVHALVHLAPEVLEHGAPAGHPGHQRVIVQPPAARGHSVAARGDHDRVQRRPVPQEQESAGFVG
jgi:hypothetical protein